MVGRDDLRAIPEAWRAYLDVALGLTEASRQQATRAVRRLVGKGGATAEQLQSMAEDLINTGLANRESLLRLVRFELERGLGRLGLATADEVTELTARVRDLERELRQAQAAGVAEDLGPADLGPADLGPAGAGTSTPGPSNGRAPHGRAAGGRAAAGPTTPAMGKDAAVKKAVAKKAVAKKAVAKKAVAKKAVGKKAAPKRAGGAAPTVPTQPPRDGEDRP